MPKLTTSRRSPSEKAEAQGAARRLRHPHPSVRAGGEISVRAGQPLHRPRCAAGNLLRACRTRSASPPPSSSAPAAMAATIRCWPTCWRNIRIASAASRCCATTRRRRRSRRLTKLGVRGMRMMSHKRGQHVPNYSKEIAARVHEHGWHIQFYPHGTDIVEYADKLLALPNDDRARPFRQHPGGRRRRSARRQGRAEDARQRQGLAQALRADALHAARTPPIRR